jgi:hypothetical protein
LNFARYQNEFWAWHGTVAFEQGTQHVGPNLPIPPSGIKTWRLDWAIMFPDNNYVRVIDQWGPQKGSLRNSSRYYFSYHYGETPTTFDSRGFPRRHHAASRIIRIDMKTRQDVHLHYENKDHVPEAQVHGFTIRDADARKFIEAVLEHRSTQKTFGDLLGFTL